MVRKARVQLKHHLARPHHGATSPTWTRGKVATQATLLAVFGVGFALVATLATALDWREITPSLAFMLYATLAVWAEVVLVLPRYAGWPSRLFPIVTLILVRAAPVYVVPGILLAVIVRVARRRLRQPERWPWATLAMESGGWLAAGAAGVAVVRVAEATLRQGGLGTLLFQPSFGEPGKLVLAIVWASTFALSSTAAGALYGRIVPYTWQELAIARRLRRNWVHAMLWSSVVYGVVALCDATLTVYGPPVVGALVAVGLATIAWQERRRQHEQARLVELAALVEAKDADTGQHLFDVAQRTALVAAELDLSARLIEDVSGRALLHDLGKLAVSSQVLTKPGTLEPQEWEEVRAHTTIGRALLRSLPDLTTAVAIAGHHHERWDGRGYPDGLAGTLIPLAARIVCVVDAFDAMTTDRPCHQAIPQDRAFADLARESGRQFDVDVVGAFGRAMLVPARLPRWQCFAPLEE